MMFDLLTQILAEVAESAQDNSGSVFSDVIFVLGIIVIAFIIMRTTMRRVMRSKQRSKIPIQQRLADKRKIDDTYIQMNELMAALADLSRQINGQIDTRLAKLDILLQQADETIERLSQSASDMKQNTLQKPDPPIVNTATDTVKGISEKFHSSIELTEKNRQVLDLAKQGLSAIAIAQQLSRPIGEIQLILSLAGRKER